VRRKIPWKKRPHTDHGFILAFWAGVFEVLSKISLFFLVRKLKKKMTYAFVEGWVLGNLLMAFAFTLVAYDPYREAKKRKPYRIKSPTRMVILLLHNYVEVMLWYAGIIIALIQLSGTGMQATWGEYVRSSILSVATFDAGAMQDVVGDLYPRLSSVVFLQVMTGIIMTIISLARFIGLMPGVESIDR